VFHFDPSKKSNQELDFSSETTVVWENNNYTIKTENGSFDWSNGGYGFDKDGNPCFCIKAGSTATIDYKLFGDSFVKAKGKEFKIIFKTDRVSSNNPVFLTCLEEKSSG
jgi:hypothetical protein